MEETGDLPSTVAPQQDGKEQLEDEIMLLRHEKARTKTLFTKARHRLLVIIQEKDVTAETIQDACETLDGTLETAMDTMMNLTDKYKETGERDSNSELCQEIESLR